jgi:hypothetical protein
MAGTGTFTDPAPRELERGAKGRLCATRLMDEQAARTKIITGKKMVSMQPDDFDASVRPTRVTIIHADHPQCGESGYIERREIVLGGNPQTLLVVQLDNGIRTKCGADYVIFENAEKAGVWNE